MQPLHLHYTDADGQRQTDTFTSDDIVCQFTPAIGSQLDHMIVDVDVSEAKAADTAQHLHQLKAQRDDVERQLNAAKQAQDVRQVADAMQTLRAIDAMLPDAERQAGLAEAIAETHRTTLANAIFALVNGPERLRAAQDAAKRQPKHLDGAVMDAKPLARRLAQDVERMRADLLDAPQVQEVTA